MPNDIKFTASARIPTRPLSYANKEMSEAKELIADYEKAQLYISDVNGKLVNISGSVTEIIDRVKEDIKKDPSMITDATITLPSGSTITISAAILEVIAKTGDIEKALGGTRDEEGNLILHIPASSITEDSTHRFVTDEEKARIGEKEVEDIYATILSGDDKWTADDDGISYTQVVAVEAMKEEYNPIIDSRLSDDYTSNTDILTNYSYIYKILTQNGGIKVYAVNPTAVDIPIIIKINK